jgi:hypothetical protein
MNRPLLLLICNLPAVACVIFSGILALHGIPGWGWFLFVGLMTTSYLSSSESSN